MFLIQILLAVAAVTGSFVGFFVESWQWFGWVAFGLNAIAVFIGFIRNKGARILYLVLNLLVPGGIALGLAFLSNPKYGFAMSFCFLFNIIDGLLALYGVLLQDIQVMGDSDE